MKRTLALILLLSLGTPVAAAEQPALLLRPERVFDGVNPTSHVGWQVLVRGDRIEAVGRSLAVPADARIIELPGQTLIPGMIEGHGHLFLHPYNEAKWDDQVLHESLALRTARAVVAARVTLMAGFTTVRDLGTEGAGFADVGLRQAIDQGIVPGPRLIVATKAMVARGAYGPKGFEPGVEVPLGAQEASGVDELVKAVRDQIAAGADVINFTATIVGARARTAGRRSHWLNFALASKRRTMPGGRSQFTPPHPKACDEQSLRAPTRSSMVMAPPRKF